MKPSTERPRRDGDQALERQAPRIHAQRMHARCAGDDVARHAQPQVQRRQLRRKLEARQRVQADQQQVRGLRQRGHAEQQVALVGLHQHDHRAGEVEHQRQRGHQPEHRAQPRVAARGGAHLHRRSRSASFRRTLPSCSAAEKAAPLASWSLRCKSSTTQRGERRASSTSGGSSRLVGHSTPSRVSPTWARRRGVAGAVEHHLAVGIGAPAGVDVRRARQRAQQREQAHAAEQRQHHQRAAPPAEPAAGDDARASASCAIGSCDESMPLLAKPPVVSCTAALVRHQRRRRRQARVACSGHATPGLACWPAPRLRRGWTR